MTTTPGAHARSIAHRCARCGAPATFEVFNRVNNASQGYGCTSCAPGWVKALNRPPLAERVGR